MKPRMFLPTIILSVIAIPVLTIGCAQQQPQKIEMPITASSQEAVDLFKKGRDLSERLRISEARRCLEEAIAKDSNFAMAYHHLATMQLTRDAMLSYLNKAFALIENVSQGERNFLLAVQADFIHNDAASAQKFYEKLIEMFPLDKRAHLALGWHHQGNQRYEKAIAEYRRAVEIDTGFPGAYNALGYCYSFLGRYAEAEGALKKYAELIPNEANPHDSYGEILMKQGKFDESFAAYRKALTIDSSFHNAYLGLGMSMVLKGRADEGRREFKALYDVAADDGWRRFALWALAHSYIFEGEFEMAMEEMHKNYAIAKKNGSMIEMAGDVSLMGDILLETGKPNEAGVKYREAARLYEESDIATKEQKESALQALRYGQVEIALKQGDVGLAKARAKEFRVNAETSKSEYERMSSHALAGMIALHERLYDDALRELQQANQRNPRNLYRIAEAYAGKGDMVKAKEFWTRAANFNEMSTSYAFVRNNAIRKLSQL